MIELNPNVLSAIKHPHQLQLSSLCLYFLTILAVYLFIVNFILILSNIKTILP